jgi:hypothetical protein
MSNKDVEKCHTVIMIHGQCKNEWCYASGICALCKKCDDCCQCAYLPCASCDCDACIKISKDTSKTDDQDIWDRLSDELYERRTAMTEMSEQITKLRNERDEARRMYCSVVENSRPHGTSAEDVAKNRGWDCYKKDETK